MIRQKSVTENGWGHQNEGLQPSIKEQTHGHEPQLYSQRQMTMITIPMMDYPAGGAVKVLTSLRRRQRQANVNKNENVNVIANINDNVNNKAKANVNKHEPLTSIAMIKPTPKPTSMTMSR